MAAPRPAVPRVARKEISKLLARAQLPPPDLALRFWEGGAGGGAAPRRLPGFLHQPLNTAHKPVAQAFPRTGVAPKGVPGDGGFLLVGSGALTLYHGPRCAPHLSLSPAWTESDISRAPSSGRWSVEPPQVGGGDFRARTLDGEDLEPYPPVSLLVLQSKQKPEPSSPSGTAKELEENAQIANTERCLCARR